MRVWSALTHLEKEFPHDSQGLGRHFLYGYDGNGNRIDSTDPLDVQTHSAFDARNRSQTLTVDHRGRDPSTAVKVPQNEHGKQASRRKSMCTCIVSPGVSMSMPEMNHGSDSLSST